MLFEFEQAYLKRQLKILPPLTQQWTLEELERLLALVKIPEPLHGAILNMCESLEANKMGEALDSSTNSLTFFPYLKLKTILAFLTNESEEEVSEAREKNSLFLEETWIREEVIIALKVKVDSFPESLIIALTSGQIGSMLEESGLEGEAAMVRKYSMDGFSLVCSLTDELVRWETMNYYRVEQIRVMGQLSLLFVAHYSRQIHERGGVGQFLKKESSNSEPTSNKVVQEFNNGGLLIECSNILKKMSEDEIEDEDFGGESDLGESDLGESDLGESIFGMSQTGDSHEAISEIGDSVHTYFQRGSIYAESVVPADSRCSTDFRTSYRISGVNVRGSSMYDLDMLTELKNSCLSVPFDLLNLEPLQTIKLRAMSMPFGKEKGPEHWQFSVQGVKFGRDKENDLSFPDEMSISSRHAKIYFRHEVFFLQDLGSKIGTYLRISDKELLIEDQTCVQFPPEAELVFKILKKAPQEGVIKAEIRKPENFSYYKISLKEGFRIRIGKSSKCHINIKSNSVADKHSEITYRNGNFYFKNYRPSLYSWLRLSPKAVRSEPFKLSKGDIFRLSSKKSFCVEELNNEIIDYPSQEADWPSQQAECPPQQAKDQL